VKAPGGVRRCSLRIFPPFHETAHNATRRVRGSGSYGGRRRQ
jgi:hypothetical protein